jgi:hypothetical protein
MDYVNIVNILIYCGDVFHLPPDVVWKVSDRRPVSADSARRLSMKYESRNSESMYFIRAYSIQCTMDRIIIIIVLGNHEPNPRGTTDDTETTETDSPTRNLQVWAVF